MTDVHFSVTEKRLDQLSCQVNVSALQQEYQQDLSRFCKENMGLRQEFKTTSDQSPFKAQVAEKLAASDLVSADANTTTCDAAAADIMLKEAADLLKFARKHGGDPSVLSKLDVYTTLLQQELPRK